MLPRTHLLYQRLQCADVKTLLFLPFRVLSVVSAPQEWLDRADVSSSHIEKVFRLSQIPSWRGTYVPITLGTGEEL